MIHFDEIELYPAPRKTLVENFELFRDTPGEPEMTEFESAFLCGILKKFKPKKILEVGVAAGATTGIILQCMTELRPNGFTMYSVDYSTIFYRDKDSCTGYRRQTGFLIDQPKDYLLSNGFVFSHTLFLGNIGASFIDQIGSDIDCLILDTFHTLPGEDLEFVSLLPHLKDGAIVVLHDICYNYIHGKGTHPKPNNMYATGVLFASVTGEKYLNHDSTRIGNYPNIGAFKVDQNTRANISDVLLSLFITWNYIPSKRQIDLYKKQMTKYNQVELEAMFNSILALNFASEEQIFHFPFELIPDISKIVLYGRGPVGMIYREQIDKYFSTHQNHFDLIGWIDQHNIFDIQQMDFDYVVIAIGDHEVATKVQASLVNLGISKEKIIKQ